MNSPQRTMKRVVKRTGPSLLSLTLFFSVIFALVPAQVSANSGLRRAQQLFRTSKYRKATVVLQGVVENRALGSTKRAQAAELLAICYLLLGEVPWAEKAFARLLNIAPDHRLRLGAKSKRVKAAFAKARKAYAKRSTKEARATGSSRRRRRRRDVEQKHPVVEVAAGPQLRIKRLPDQAQATAGRVWRLVVELEGALDPGSLTLYGATLGQSYVDHPMRQQNGRWIASIPLPESQKQTRFKYFIEAKDGRGEVVARLGKHAEPLVESVAAQKNISRPIPVYKRWWFWTIIGVAVAGGATAGLVVGLDNVPEGSLAPGVVRLR